MTDLSIIIVSFNTLEMTRECLRSIESNLRGLEYEILLIDNASSDGSPDMVAKEFPNAQLIRNKENRGFAAANNQGFAVAKGRHLLMLNSDTIVLGDVLQRSVEFMRSNPGVGAMGCRVLNTDRTLQRTCSMEPTLLNLTLMLLALDGLARPRWFGRYQYRHWDRLDRRDVEVVSGCYLLTTREVLDKVGTLDESFFFFGEETDWCMRVRRAGLSCVLAPVGEIVHHGGGSVKKLNHRRDLMLTEAIVRLHRKHGGALAAAAVWCVLFAFNSSRWAGYALKRILLRSAAAKDRSVHFRRVSAAMLRPGAKAGVA